MKLTINQQLETGRLTSSRVIGADAFILTLVLEVYVEYGQGVVVFTKTVPFCRKWCVSSVP